MNEGGRKRGRIYSYHNNYLTGVWGGGLGAGRQTPVSAGARHSSDLVPTDPPCPEAAREAPLLQERRSSTPPHPPTPGPTHAGANTRHHCLMPPPRRSTEGLLCPNDRVRNGGARSNIRRSGEGQGDPDPPPSNNGGI